MSKVVRALSDRTFGKTAKFYGSEETARALTWTNDPIVTVLVGVAVTYLSLFKIFEHVG